MRYWRISPGEGGRLWREQKLHDCVSIGWWDIGNLKHMSKKGLESAVKKLGWSKQALNQIRQFRDEVNKGDKVIASSSRPGVYALGTVMGDYQFRKDLEYRQTRKVQWETTFWNPVKIESLNLPEQLYNKFHGRASGTIRELTAKEWDCLSNRLNEVNTPFRNLGMWGGLVQSPEYENEVIILFSQMLQHLNMRIVSFGTRFPDATVERKRYGKWKRLNVEFELYSSGFKHHLHEYINADCYTIICWEDDWDRPRNRETFEIIELKSELEKML